MSIKIEHVSHLYGEGEAFEKKALDDETLEIPDGQFLGVTDPSSERSFKSNLRNDLL